MTDYKVGYKKPPKHTRFKAGVSGNPNGRKKQDASSLARAIQDAVTAPTPYRQRGSIKRTSRQSLAIKVLIDHAVAGNIGAAEHLLKVREHAQRFGDAGAQKLLIADWLPDYPGQTADQKTNEFTRTGVADPLPWWQEPRSKLRNDT